MFTKNRAYTESLDIGPEIIQALMVFSLSAKTKLVTQQLLSTDTDGCRQYISCPSRPESSYCLLYRDR